MKIVNICISAPYIEGFSYQENILPDYLIKEGIETSIIANNILPSYIENPQLKPGVYFEKNKKIIRIKCFKISSDFMITFDLFNQLKNEAPDVIIHHNLNCTSLVICTFYKILNPNVILLVDNHADYINCNKNKYWHLFYHKFLVRLSAKFSSIFTKKFYGVTYSRCDYLNQVYGVKKTKIEFLPIGADVKSADSITEGKFDLRVKYQIPLDSIVVVTGGKMGKDKGTYNLIKAVNEINNVKIVLLLFGSFNDVETENLAKHSKFVVFKGWCDRRKALCHLKLADVAVWPVHHTTLIEDAISVNTPLLIRKTRTTEHLIDGNGLFLDTIEYSELYHKIKIFVEDFRYTSYEGGCRIMRERLDYTSIVKKILKDVSC